MNPNVSGLLAIAIFSTGTLLMSLLKAIPIFQLGFIAFMLGAFSINVLEKTLGRDVRAVWKQPFSSYVFVTFGVVL